MVVVCKSNDEIPPNTNREFQSRSGGLDCFKITYIKSNAKKTIVQKDLNLIIPEASIISWKVREFFFEILSLHYLKKLKFAVVAYDYVILCFAIPTLYYTIVYV
jgi:hypothetical protein